MAGGHRTEGRIEQKSQRGGMRLGRWHGSIPEVLRAGLWNVNVLWGLRKLSKEVSAVVDVRQGREQLMQ